MRSSLPPVEGIFYDGQIFDAYAHIISLIKQAKHSIVLIDNYIDENTLIMLSKRNASVSATIYTRQLSQQQQLDLQRHNNSKKIWPNYLEIAKTHRTFALWLRIKR